MSRAAASRHGPGGLLAAAEQAARGKGARAPLFLRRLREEGVAAFGRLGLPGPEDEEWRYTNVAPLASGTFAPAPPTAPEPERAEERRRALALDARLGPFAFTARKRPQIVFVNGRYQAEWSSLEALPPGLTFEPLAAAVERRPHLLETHLGRAARVDEHPFVALNTAHLLDGAFVHVTKQTSVETPLTVFWVSTGPAAGVPPVLTAPRFLVVLEEGSRASVVEAFVGSGGATFTNAVTEASLAPNALLDHVKLQREGAETLHFGNARIVQQASSQSRSRVFSFGGKLVRNETAVLLDGEGAGTSLDGLFLASGAQHVDNHTLIDHARPHGASQEFYKGILDGSARGAFDGRIVVRPGARRTDAHQTNRNLILSDTALVDSKPQLEIYNNDVKCTHGSTTGRLDETALFYLRSRGLDEEAARSLLTFAFGSEIVERVSGSDLHPYLEASLLSWLSHANAVPEGS
jgi:Fe-S cluster assembly protein SufD